MATKTLSKQPYQNLIKTTLLNETQKKFNKTLSSARVTIERAFGLLKGRWRCLLKRLDHEIENIAEIVFIGLLRST